MTSRRSPSPESAPILPFDRELSWIAFNGRVLQEAQNPELPLLERLSFLAIVSSNLDEFFRVRVASLRTLLRLKKKKLRGLGINPHKLLRDIHRAVHVQQEAFGQTLRGEVLPGLAREGIKLVNEKDLPDAFHGFVREYFRSQVRPLLKPVDVQAHDPTLFLEDRESYLAVGLWPRRDGREGGERPSYVLLRIPTDQLPRFVTLGPGGRAEAAALEGAQDAGEPEDSERWVMFLDDVIRFNLGSVFPDSDIGGAYAVKLSRDADLALEDEFSGDLAGQMRKALSKRAKGVPSRFLYDPQAPYAMISTLKECLGLEDDDLIAGGRYHNLSDFFSFPRFDRTDLTYESLEPLPHPVLDGAACLFDTIRKRDRLLHFPYQSFETVLAFLKESAHDPRVEEIWISLYRVARDSQVVRSLIEAARGGKQVTAVVEVQARFDEASNLAWADRMEEAGVRVLYSKPGIKVHAKMVLVSRREGDSRRRYAYLATGNLNEKTARIYADFGLFTANREITGDVRQVFAELDGQSPASEYSRLIVAPADMRSRFEALVRGEIERARAGHDASMILKMNSLEDPGMVELVGEAAASGVHVDLIVRGICCLPAEVVGSADGLRVRSIVDRFLEHARVFVFHNGGDELVYIASADWMVRNLDRRFEIAVPLHDSAVRKQVRDVLDLQLRDNTKARWIDAAQSNPFVEDGGPRVRSQVEHYRYLERLLDSTQAEGASTPDPGQ